MRFSLLAAFLVILVSCTPAGDQAGPAETTPAAEPGAAATSTSAPTEATAEAPPAAPTEEPTQEPGGGAGVSGATLTIGDTTYSFDEVEFCAMSVLEDETISFIMITQQDGVQLVAQINDPTGERRLDGDGVWAMIQVVEPPQTVEGFQVFPGWSASGEATGEQFIVLDGQSVTASAQFDDFAGEFAQVPGNLEATCA